jgi:Peptidase family M1 domain
MPRHPGRTAAATALAVATVLAVAALGLTAPAISAAAPARPAAAAPARPAAGAPAAAPAGAPAGRWAGCSAGARTLAPRGSRMYPETGNGGYTSVHTAVHLTYDAATNRFLRGTHVVLTDRATQCLTSFSLDLERTSVNSAAGPRLTVGAVLVDGRPARFRFVQPTYPGDPRGQDDPNPLAHQASEVNPVGGPRHNPLPPACTPELTSTSAQRQDAKNGTPCPADKLVITPRRVIPDGAPFTVSVSYTGRPGVHNDGDGTTEGWFRARDGGFVTTEPVGTEDWMPLNDYPAAKPTYDFYDTIGRGETALANGILMARTRHRPDRAFPRGSVTWHWHSPAPVASYLVEDSVGKYHLTERTARGGRRYYEAQDTSISAKQQAKNLKIMNLQQNITQFESQLSGPFPFTSDGVVVGTPQASFEEEMQTMITFAGGEIDTDTLYHENMHQWWGDHVTEAGYTMTFYKEGLATLAEYLFAARQAQARAGGPATAAGRAAFQASLVAQFNRGYGSAGGFWTQAPSDPTPFSLFDSASTYDRPGLTYIALRQILGAGRFDRALAAIQRRYGGRSITEPELTAAFARWLPNRSPACGARLRAFFTQWFDTGYPAGGGARRPQVTGPGLAGPGFYAVPGCTHR